MSRQSRFCLRPLGLTLALALAAAFAALAPAPAHAVEDTAAASLAKLSDDVQVAIVIPDLTRTNRALADLGRRYDLPVPEIGDLLSAFKREAGMYGMDDDGAMLIVFQHVERALRGDGRPDVFVLVPVRSYATFVETYDGDPDAEVTPLALPRHTGYARNLGTHALLGATEQGVADYQPLDNGAALAERLGPYGRRYLAQASAGLYLDAAALRPIAEQALADLAAESESESDSDSESEAEPSDGADDPDAPAAMQMRPALAAETVEELASGVLGFLEGIDTALLTLEADEQGIALTKAVAYAADAPLATHLEPGRSDLGEALARLPDQPFLLASAVDMPAVSVAGWLDRLDADQVMPADAMDAMRTLIDRSGTIASAYYTPTRQLLMAGNLLNQVTIVETDDPAGYRAALRRYIESLDGMTVGQAPGQAQAQAQFGAGQALSTAFIPGAVRVGETDVDQYQIRLPAGLSQDMAQAAPMVGMLGLQGTTGYIAAVEGHVIMTTQPNPQLVRRAIETIATGMGLGAATAEELAERQRQQERQQERQQRERREQRQAPPRPDGPGPPEWARPDMREPGTSERERRRERQRERERERERERDADAPRTIADLRAAALPESTIFEGYLSLSGIVATIELVMPLGDGAGGPGDLPPLAVGLGVEGHNAAARIYVPHQNVRFVLDTVRDMGLLVDPDAELDAEFDAQRRGGPARGQSEPPMDRRGERRW